MTSSSAESAEQIAPAEAQPPAAEARSNPVRKIALIILVLLVVLFIYSVLSDRFTPYTSHARVDTFLVQIAPEVAGDVIAVGAKENAHVRKGQMLFRIDPEPYRIAVQSAEANLAAALQDAQVSEADVVASKALLNKQRVDLDASHKLGKIVTDLVAEHALPKTNGIRAEADIAETRADVAKAEADVRRAEANLGSPGASNAKVRQAIAALDQAQLDLERTNVVAAADGVVTNLRLAPGQYVANGQPLLSFLQDGPRWISANLRENQLGNVASGQQVLVALDVDPGRLFKGRVHSIGWGIKQGDEAPTGQLADVPPDQGWLRQPQRFPVRVQLLEDSGRTGVGAGRSGAQANVIIFTSDRSLLNPIGRLWIWAITMLSYLQ
jgi:multidrug resistance efflux pump